MNRIRILIALAAVALAAVVAAAPASPQSLSLGTPLLGDQDLGVNLPNLGGGSSGGSAGSGGGGGGGGGGNAATGNVTSGDTSADVNVACIDANVLDITAKIGSCNGAGGGGGGGGDAGDGAGGGGERGAADAEAGSGELGANAGVGCIDIGLGDLGDGLQIGSCEAMMPPSTEDPDDGDGSGELPTETGDGGVAGADAGADGSAGDEADCIAYDELSNSGLPYGIPPWLAGILGVVVGAFIARRRRPQAEDVAV